MAIGDRQIQFFFFFLKADANGDFFGIRLNVLLIFGVIFEATFFFLHIHDKNYEMIKKNRLISFNLSKKRKKETFIDTYQKISNGYQMEGAEMHEFLVISGHGCCIQQIN